MKKTNEIKDIEHQQKQIWDVEKPQEEGMEQQHDRSSEQQQHYVWDPRGLKNI